MIYGVASLTIKSVFETINSFSEKSVKETDVAAGPSDGYTNLGVEACLESFGAPANWIVAVMLGQRQSKLE